MVAFFISGKAKTSATATDANTRNTVSAYESTRSRKDTMEAVTPANP